MTARAYDTREVKSATATRIDALTARDVRNATAKSLTRNKRHNCRHARCVIMSTASFQLTRNGLRDYLRIAVHFPNRVYYDIRHSTSYISRVPRSLKKYRNTSNHRLCENLTFFFQSHYHCRRGGKKTRRMWYEKKTVMMRTRRRMRRRTRMW